MFSSRESIQNRWKSVEKCQNMWKHVEKLSKLDPGGLPEPFQAPGSGLRCSGLDFATILGAQKEPKGLPNRSGIRQNVDDIEHPVSVSIPDTKTSGFGRQNGLEIDPKLRSDCVGSGNLCFSKHLAFTIGKPYFFNVR